MGAGQSIRHALASESVLNVEGAADPALAGVISTVIAARGASDAPALDEREPHPATGACGAIAALGAFRHNPAALQGG